MYIFTKNEKYIGMDTASGGYPYETDRFMDVKVWQTKEKAENYLAKFKDERWQLRKLHGLNMSLPI